MSPNKLIVLVPAIVVLVVAGSCGYRAHMIDAAGGEFGNIAQALTVLGSMALALALGAAALLVRLVAKKEGREVVQSLLLAAAMMPIGVIVGFQLGDSGVIPPAPTPAPESQPSPPPTGAAQAGRATGTVTLDLDPPNELHVTGEASCESAHSFIHEWDQNSDWDVDWSGRVVIIGVQLYLLSDPPAGPTWVDRMTIHFADKSGDAVTYSSNGSLAHGASSARDGGQSGAVQFELNPVAGAAGTAAPGSQWPASVKGQISWLCDF